MTEEGLSHADPGAPFKAGTQTAGAQVPARVHVGRWPDGKWERVQVAQVMICLWHQVAPSPRYMLLTREIAWISMKRIQLREKSSPYASLHPDFPPWGRKLCNKTCH